MTRNRDYWIYSPEMTSEGDIPWAMHISATKERRRVTADIRLYAEWLPCASHEMSFTDVNLKGIGFDRFIEDFKRVAEGCGRGNNQRDVAYIKREVAFFLDNL